MRPTSRAVESTLLSLPRPIRKVLRDALMGVRDPADDELRQHLAHLLDRHRNA